MIGPVGGTVLDWAAARRRRRLERVSRDAIAVQEATLRAHVRTARDTEFGLAHGFASVRSVADYQTRVPPRDYLGFRPSWAAVLAGAHGVTWPGRARLWAKTSGTTAGDKAIPVTPEAFRSHQRGGWDALLMAAERVGGRALLGGPMLMLGGSTTLQAGEDGALIGDLSGLMARRLPRGLRGRYSPGPAIARIPDWETRLAAVASLVARQDLRLISGMPSWTLILLEHVASHLGGNGRSDLADVWPRLRVFIHGGVSFAPYRTVFEARLGRRLPCVEVYPASEGFVAVQTEPTGGLTLMLDYGIFYEFVPVEDLGEVCPRRHTVADVELGRPYAVALTTPAGLWSYLLGDTVRFTARDPLRLVITGRTRHFVNAFGENVIVEEVERALLAACHASGAEVAEFTVAPRFPEPGEPRGGHDWLVEFRVAPWNRQEFTAALDDALQAANTDYRTKRSGNLGMQPPRVIPLPAGTFQRWMRAAGTLGDQHKVPRATNTRALAEAVLAEAAVGGSVPVSA
jgi:GH3 auxin-responsive promoter